MATVGKCEGKKGVSGQIAYFDPNGKRVRESFKKRKDAVDELADRVSLIAEQRYLDVKKAYKTTLGELLDTYEENFQHQACFKNWKVFCIGRLKAEFGQDARLANIRYVDLETYRNQLKKTPAHRGTVRMVATVNREMSCIHHIFSKAVNWEMVEKSLFDNGESLLIKENDKRFRYLSEEEIDRLLPECSLYVRRIVECAIRV